MGVREHVECIMGWKISYSDIENAVYKTNGILYPDSLINLTLFDLVSIPLTIRRMTHLYNESDWGLDYPRTILELGNFKIALHSNPFQDDAAYMILGINFTPEYKTKCKIPVASFVEFSKLLNDECAKDLIETVTLLNGKYAEPRLFNYACLS